MSLTNPNTPVSQQDLQDFYHKLLPYMGNSFAMIANKFSKGDLYSTDEKMIGQWIDGKPLYQKVINIENLPNATTKSVAHNISNVENIFIKDGFAKTATDDFNTLPYLRIDNSNFGVEITVNLTNVVIKTYADRSAWIGYVILQYTKTTDSAISIGSDTDYSTEEKIVGTWIDGSPIWQKTVSGTMPASGSDTKISVSSDVIDFALTCKGVVPEYRTQPMSDYISVSNSTLMMTFFDTEEQKVYLRNNNVPAVQGKTAYVTVTYIKTTD